MSEPISESYGPQGQLGQSRAGLFRFIMIVGLLAFLGLGLLAAEWSARQYERNRVTPPDYVPQIFYPHRRLRYGLVPNLDYYGWFKINSLGFRGREFSVAKRPGNLRIVCLGGSTTFDIGSIGKDSPWPEVLERELRQRLGTQSIEVLNLGIPGATSLDSLIDLQMRVIDLKPDLVIVYQGHNDFIYSVPPPEPVKSSLYPFESAPRSSLVRWLTNHSLLYAKTQGRVIDTFAAAKRAVVSLFSSNSVGSKSIVQSTDESLEQGYNAYRSNVNSIAAIARANGLPLVLVQVVLPFPERSEGQCAMCTSLPSLLGGLPQEKISAMFKRYDGALAAVAAQGDGVHYVHALDFVPSADRYYHDPIHFGPAGSMLMGAKLAEAVAPILSADRPVQ